MAEVFSYDKATLTIGGEVFELDGFSCERRDPVSRPELPARVVFEVSATFDVKLSAPWDDLLDALLGRVKPPAPFRLPLATLMRRAGYGGRKGRRALRRALDRPDPEWEAWSR